MTQMAVLATLEAKAGCTDHALEVLQEVAKHSCKEKGNLQYHLHRSLENENVFLLYELWESPEAIEEHGQTPHYLKYRENIEPLVVSRNVQRWSLLSK